MAAEADSSLGKSKQNLSTDIAISIVDDARTEVKFGTVFFAMEFGYTVVCDY